MPDASSIIDKNGNIITFKDETARSDIQTLSTNKLTKPNNTGYYGDAIFLNYAGVPKWGIPNDTHRFNRQLPFNDLTQRFANEITAIGNGNPWKWLHQRLSSRSLSNIHLGDYIKFSFAIGEGPSLEYTARIHDIYLDYFDRPVIDFWCDELLPDAIAWNDKLSQADSQYYFNEGLQDSTYTGHQMPYYCSTIYKYLNALSGYVCSSATFNSNNNTTLFGFTSEDFTQTGVWNYIPQDLKSYIISKTGAGSMKKTITRGSYITHSTVVSSGNDNIKYLYPTLTTMSYGYLWIPTSFDFLLSNKLDLTPTNPVRVGLLKHYQAQGFGTTVQAVIENSVNMDPIIFSSYYYNRESLIKYYPEYGLLKDRNNPTSPVSFWVADLGYQYNLMTANSNMSSRRTTISSNARSYSQFRLPLCFTIG